MPRKHLVEPTRPPPTFNPKRFATEQCDWAVDKTWPNPEHLQPDGKCRFDWPNERDPLYSSFARDGVYQPARLPPRQRPAPADHPIAHSRTQHRTAATATSRSRTTDSAAPPHDVSLTDVHYLARSLPSPVATKQPRPTQRPVQRSFGGTGPGPASGGHRRRATDRAANHDRPWQLRPPPVHQRAPGTITVSSHELMQAMLLQPQDDGTTAPGGRRAAAATALHGHAARAAEEAAEGVAHATTTARQPPRAPPSAPTPASPSAAPPSAPTRKASGGKGCGAGETLSARRARSGAGFRVVTRGPEVPTERLVGKSVSAPRVVMTKY